MPVMESDACAEALDPVIESIPVVRRSSRQRHPPGRLQYAALGKPLLSAMQTVFHGLIDAYGEAVHAASVASPLASRVYDV